MSLPTPTKDDLDFYLKHIGQAKILARAENMPENEKKLDDMAWYSILRTIGGDKRSFSEFESDMKL